MLKRMIATIIVVLVTVGTCMAGEMTMTAVFDSPVMETGTEFPLTVRGTSHTYLVNDWPAMPYRLVIRELPAGTTVTDVRAERHGTGTLTLTSPLPGSRGVHLISDANKPLPYPVLDPDTAWPDQNVIWSVHGGLNPVTLQHQSILVMRIFPAQLTRPDRIQFARQVTVTVLTEESRTVFTNPSMSRENQPFVIVVPETMTGALTPYIAHKTTLGLVPEVVTIESILQTFPGVDDPQKLRNFIQSKVEINATSFVLLAGDADVMPVRRTLQEYDPLGVTYLPMEAYFSDLYDGAGNPIDWDADDNGNFGAYPGDLPAMDFLADVFVSRIPASNESELTTALNNIIAYESQVQPGADWFNRVLFAAVDIFNEREHGDTSGIPEGELFAEQLAEYPFNAVDVVRLYETDTYPCDGWAYPDSVVTRASEGAGFLAFHCHGAPDCLWLIDDCFTHAHAANFTNTWKLPVMFGFACSTAAFDNEIPGWPYTSGGESMPEHFLLNPNGGAISYVGATRVAMASGYSHAQYRTATGAIEYPYYCAWFEGLRTPAMMMAAADRHYIETVGYTGYYDYFTIGEYAQFGDPTLAVGGAPSEPEFILANHWFTAVTGDGDGCIEPGETAALTLTVLNTGTTGNDLTVNLSCTDPEITLPVTTAPLNSLNRYESQQLTNIFSVEVDAAATVDRQVLLTVEIRSGSVLADQAVIPLFIGSGASLTSDDWDIVYDSTNNANPDPGDHIYPVLFLKNIGCETARGLVLTVSTNSQYTDWCTTNYEGAMGDIPPGWGSESGWAVIDIGISESCPHGTDITLDIIITDADGRTWPFTITIPVTDRMGPRVSDTVLSTRSPDAGDAIQITTTGYDVSGIQQVTAEIQRFPDGPVMETELFDDGAHNDGTAGDGVFSGIYITGTEPGDFIVTVTAADLRGNNRVFEEESAFSTVPMEKLDLLVIASSPDLEAGSTIMDSIAAAGLTASLWDERFRGLPDVLNLNDYRDSAVIWTFGWSDYPSETERAVIADYLDSGGGILLSGWDLARNASRQGGREWLETYFGVASAGTNADDFTVTGVSGDPLLDGFSMRLQKKNAEVSFTPDILTILGDAEARMIFAVNTDAPGLVARRGQGFCTAFLPFALEHVRIDTDRADFLAILAPWLADHPMDPDIHLKLNHDYFHAGDAFVLTAECVNPFPAPLAVREFIALNVGGAFWFWPDWVLYPPGIDYEDMMLEPFTRDIRTILDFQWPETGAAASGLMFYAILTDPATGTALSDLDMVEFGFGN